MLKLITCAIGLLATLTSHVNAQGSIGGQWTLVGESGVSAMHGMLMPTTNKIIFLDKWQTTPFVEIAGAEGLGAEYDIDTNVYRPLALQTNTFCSAGGYLPDGTMVSIGGAKGYNDPDYGSATPGFYSIRLMKPCNDGTCNWELSTTAKLNAPRWYPSVEALSDGTLFIIGGSSASTQFNNANIGTSSFELYPPRAGITNPTAMPFLVNTYPNNLYPIVLLLPDGSLFVFANTQAIILSTTTFATVATLPNIPGGPRSYPVTGGGVLLPLGPQNNYTADILICGGSTLDAANNSNSNPVNTCARIKPLIPGAQWEPDTMPSVRVMPDLVLMSDGNIVVVNGAQLGTSGWGLASHPNYVPFLYNKDATLGQRWTTGTPAMIARMYHSVAMTIPDGRVIIAGSNPNENPSMLAPFPSDFRVEIYTPPFLFQGYPQPLINTAPTAIKYNQPFALDITTYQKNSTVLVSMANSGFVTHSTHMSQRYVYLQVTAATSGAINVQGPPTPNVLPPGYYMLRIIESGVPSKAVWVLLSA